jgi:hypothetical protein
MKPTIVIILILIPTVFSLSLCGNDFTSQEIEKKFFRKIVEIDDVFAIPRLDVDEDRIYIVDKKHCTLNLFNKKDGRKINTVGKRGEGPGEFLFISKIHFNDDMIYVSSPPKLSIFSREGKLLKEKRTHLIGGGEFIPFGNNYLYSRYIYERKGNSTAIYLGYTLLDENLKEIKSIFKTPFNRPWSKDKNKTPLLIFHECRKGIVYKERFYIGYTELGFYIAVFDISGNKLFEIKHDYDKIRVKDDIKQKILSYYKSKYPDDFRKMLSRREVFFPEYFPAFVNFFIHDDKIYVLKYPMPGAKGRLEVLLLDLRGNLLGQKMIALGGFYRYLENPDLISFYKGKIYYIINYEEKTAVGEFSLDEFIKYYFK